MLHSLFHPCGMFIFLSLLDRAEPLLRTLGCDTFVCNSLHASFAVCGSSVKQVSHSWHIVLDTDSLYTFLNFINQFISFLNLHREPELIIVNIDFENLHSVYRSLEIHNCALTSSPLPSPHPQKKRSARMSPQRMSHESPSNIV